MRLDNKYSFKNHLCKSIIHEEILNVISMESNMLEVFIKMEIILTNNIASVLFFNCATACFVYH